MPLMFLQWCIQTAIGPSVMYSIHFAMPFQTNPYTCLFYLLNCREVFCFFASHNNLCQYDILLLPTKLITQADPRVFNINIMCTNVQDRSRYNSCFNVSRAVSSSLNGIICTYIRREFTDIILKKYHRWHSRIPHHTPYYLLANHIKLCK